MFYSIAKQYVGQSYKDVEFGLTRTGRRIVDIIDAQDRAIHHIALALDIIAGLAILIVGICGTQFGFVMPAAQYAMIGVGSTYLFGLGIALLFKTIPDCTLIISKKIESDS